MMAGVATAVMVVFLPDRQQSARRGSRRNGGGDGYGYGNGNSSAATATAMTMTINLA
jgi:hypothetical protein